VIVAVPALTAVAIPLLLTVATPGALEAQVTDAVRSWEAGVTPVYSPMATNFAVWPMTVIGWVDGTIEIEVKPVTGVELRLTCTFDVPCSRPNAPFPLAVIVVVPEPTAVATPEEFIVAIAGELEDQVTVDVMSVVVAGWEPC
jgi:hypothetical protein